MFKVKMKPPQAAGDSGGGGSKILKMAKRSSKLVCLLSLLVVLASLEVTEGASVSVGGILGWLYSLESTFHKKTMLFYKFFGRNLSPDEVGKGSLCDMSDPNKIKNCAIPQSGRLYGNPNIPVGGGGNGDGGSSFETVPAHCLEDPDADGCDMLERAREMERALNAMNGLRTLEISGGKLPGMASQTRQGDGNDEDGGTKSPTSYVTENPTGSQATNSPTKDWCYGYVQTTNT